MKEITRQQTVIKKALVYCKCYINQQVQTLVWWDARECVGWWSDEGIWGPTVLQNMPQIWKENPVLGHLNLIANINNERSPVTSLLLHRYPTHLFSPMHQSLKGELGHRNQATVILICLKRKDVSVSKGAKTV